MYRISPILRKSWISGNFSCNLLIIGNNFHSLGAALSVEKPVILLDVYNNEIKNSKGLRNKILKQRAFSIEKLREAKNVGIIIEIKPGQKFGSPKFLVKKLKEEKMKIFPVVEKDRLIGIITETDIVDATRDFTRIHQIMQEVILTVFGLVTAFFLFFFSPLGQSFRKSFI